MNMRIRTRAIFRVLLFTQSRPEFGFQEVVHESLFGVEWSISVLVLTETPSERTVFDQVEEEIVVKVFGIFRHRICRCRWSHTPVHVREHATQLTIFRDILVDVVDHIVWHHVRRPTDQDTLLEAIDHLIHQERDIATIGEDPQLRGGFVVLEAIVPSRRFRARGFGVEPQHKLFEDRGLLGLELDDSALRFCEASVEGSLEVTRVEFEKAALGVEDAFLVANADFDGGYLADECGSMTLVSKMISL
jgi:hypothetical protein